MLYGTALAVAPALALPGLGPCPGPALALAWTCGPLDPYPLLVGQQHVGVACVRGGASLLPSWWSLYFVHPQRSIMGWIQLTEDFRVEPLYQQLMPRSVRSVARERSR